VSALSFNARQIYLLKNVIIALMNEYTKDFKTFCWRMVSKDRQCLFLSEYLILYRDTETHQDVDYITIDKDQPTFPKDCKTTNWERFVSGIRNTVIVMSLEFKIVAK
jgi:hypothetical protein